MTKDALLEIGSEELPASFIGPGMRQLKSLAEESLKASGLSYSAIETFGTPRRLAVLMHGLAERSPDQTKTVTGPPANIAKDAQGQWTAAASGFARKQGLTPSDLTIVNDRVSAVLHMKGVATRQLLSDLFPQWISKLEFPKSMEWEPSHFRYPRPIRWIVAVYGAETVSFALAGVRSGKWTYGLALQPKKIPVTQPGKYVVMRKNQCVLVEPLARQEAIRRFAEQAVKRVHGTVHMPEALLEEVANLVEHPVAILGNFDSSYLDLPKEVLVTCLEHHQKYFPVEEGSGGKLIPHFVGIRNGMSIHQEIVREGYERVLAARLADARFFYDQDCRVSLSSRVDALKGVVFQEKLGTLYDKVQRVKVLIANIANTIPGSEEWRADAVTAASLCKADLTTAMVGEFPELQGIMGRLYGEKGGLDPRVSRALEEHYWPITLTGPLPSSNVGAAVALADKLDTLAGDFAVGLIPSGSADPYGLRRAAVGILRILESKDWALHLEQLVDQAIAVQPAHVKQAASETPDKLNQFMQQRFAAVLSERGFKPDEIEAVLSAGIGVVPEALARLQALHELRKRQEFEPLSVAFKRGMNIVRQATKGGNSGDSAAVQSDLLREPCEQTLYKILESTGIEVSKHLEARAYRQALESMVPLREPLDGFFNGVMVMAEDPALRTNRLALMKRLVSLFAQIADFSKLQNA